MGGYWLFFILESLLIHTLLPADALAFGDVVYIGLILVNALVLAFAVSYRYGDDRQFMLFLTGGFLLRLVFLFWSEYCSGIFALPNSGADELTYYYNAMSALVRGKEFTGYALLFSWQARIFGLSKLYGKFVNVLLSISAILILRKILIRLDISSSARSKTLAFACFLPNFAILSALLLRESLIIFLVAVSAYYLLQWWQENRGAWLCLSLLASAGAAWLHSGMIAYTIGILCVAVSAQRSMNGCRLKLLSIRTILLSAAVGVMMLTALMKLDIGLTRYFRGADSLGDIVSIADAYEDGGSAYNANVVSNDSTLGVLINTPFRMLYFIFAPVPWDWRSASDVIAFFFSALFYGYVFFKSVPYVLKDRDFSLGPALFLIALLTLMMFGWGVSNSGTALRHRDKMVIHYLIMFALLQDKKLRVASGSKLGAYMNEV